MTKRLSSKISRFILENSKGLSFNNQAILATICGAIILFSIFLRSTFDIGADTAFYISLGQKISEGEKYYDNFFESNFPISFYIYAIESRLAALSGINPIIMSEIVINLLGILAIFSSARILQHHNFAKKAHYNIIIISFCAAFFLRIAALGIGEFGTKTSFLLLLLFPYLSYSFLEEKLLTRKNLIWRGALIGLIPCFKPHYAILIIAIEIYKFWQIKSWKFFIKLDKLIALTILAIYLNFLIQITPEFLQFMVPMWSEFYSVYAKPELFFANSARHFVKNIGILALIAPMFLYLKISKDDKILIAAFIGASLLLILENIGTIDQEVIFYAITTVALFKFSYDFFSSKYFIFNENKFITCAFIILPIFDAENFFKAIFNLTNIWWALVPLCFVYYSRFVGAGSSRPLTCKISPVAGRKTPPLRIQYFLFCIALTTLSIYSLNHCKDNTNIAINIISFAFFLFIFEKFHKKTYHKFSTILIIVALAITSNFTFLYISSIKNAIIKDNYFVSPNASSAPLQHYIKTYATKKDESFLVISHWIFHQFPLIIYADKHNYLKFAVALVYDDHKNRKTMFSNDNPDRAFVYGYLLDDLKKQILNEKIKVIIINYADDASGSREIETISSLEYCMLDPEFRKIFLQNFHFKNRILEYRKIEPKLKIITSDKFSNLRPANTKLLYDFEIYIRN